MADESVAIVFGARENSSATRGRMTASVVRYMLSQSLVGA